MLSLIQEIIKLDILGKQITRKLDIEITIILLVIKIHTKEGNVPHNKGIPCSEETKKKIKDTLTGTTNVSSYKPIIKYDLQYNEIKRYKCIKDAIDESKGLFIGGKISQCCNLKRNKHQGFIWRWDNGEPLKERDLSNNKRVPVVQYDMQLNEIGRFISLMDAQKNTGVKYQCINNCCKGIAKREEIIFGNIYKQRHLSLI